MQKLAPDDWREVLNLLDTALELPLDQRETWLDSIDASRASLKDALRDMLAKHAGQETNDYLQALPQFTQLESATYQSPLTLKIGDCIGPYQLLRELGHGGMGSVWLAERIDGRLKRQVALKLPHLNWALPDLAARMARERDILASLEHPNIARLYEADTTPLGQPYLVLEYVDGIPIDEYCDKHQLSIRERLKLFLQVLQAVRYAHAHLVIHRDLKPSNILVSTDGVVGLLDFGIAKLTIEGEARETPLTKIGGRALTLDYASPEQIAGKSLTTASDVYSLGVVLYELLTGAKPYRLKRDSRASLEDAIAEADVIAPSRAAMGADIAVKRSTSARKIAYELRGDLDAVVNTALRKHVDERYTSVDELARDIRRYLDGKPVEAHADNVWYRTTKLIKRHRVMVAAAMAIVIALAIGLGIAYWQAREAREQAVLAGRESKKATAVQQFLMDIFLTNHIENPNPLRARQTTARELLDIGAKRVTEGLAEVPDAQQEVLDTLANMYYQIGLEDKAIELHRQRIDVVKRAYGQRDARVVDALLAYIEDGEASANRLQLQAMLDEVTSILDSSGDSTSEARGRLLSVAARLYRYTSVAKLRANADQAMAFYRQYYPDSTTLIHSTQLAGKARQLAGDYMGAIDLYTQAIDIATRQESASSANAVVALIGRSESWARLANIEQAERDYRTALDICLLRYGAFHAETLLTQVKFGHFLRSTGRAELGWQYLNAAHNNVGKGPEGYTPEFAVAVIARVYGLSLLESGRIAEGEQSLAVAVTDAQQHYPNSIPLAIDLAAHGSALTTLGHYEAAATSLDTALAAWTNAAASDVSPTTYVPYLLEQARLRLAQHQASAALDLVMRIATSNGVPLTVVKTQNSPSMLLDTQSIEVATVRAEAYLQLHRDREALHSAQAALDAVTASSVRQYYPQLEAQAALILAEAQHRAGMLKDARANLERALQLRLLQDDKISPGIATAQIALANCSLDSGNREEALRLYRRAKAIHASHKKLGGHLRESLRLLASRLDQH